MSTVNVTNLALTGYQIKRSEIMELGLIPRTP